MRQDFKQTRAGTRAFMCGHATVHAPATRIKKARAFALSRRPLRGHVRLEESSLAPRTLLPI